MEELIDILEREFKKAFQVKDPDSLHRSVEILAERLVEQHTYTRDRNAVLSGIKENSASINRGFELMEERFDASRKLMDERYDALQKQLDDRFDASRKLMDERFVAFQKQLDERFDASQNLMDERFDASQKQLDERFDASQKHIAEQFRAENTRFEDMNRRFDSMHRFMGLGITILALLIAGFNMFLIFIR
jgi:DNA anti-recombination protein RmuC